MNRKLIPLLITLTLLTGISTNLFAASFFGANVGGRLNYSTNTESEKYDPELKLEAFIESQLNYSDNLWSHFDFSIKTSDFLNVGLFTATDAKFKIDEISIIHKSRIEASANYFSAYMGTYDPVGSDIFFQRYFATQPIASKITESWLGQAGSILYPHFGIGISDVIRFYEKPLALGIYAYVNNQDDHYYVFNADLRFAGVYRYFSFDIAGGLGVPLADKYSGEDAIVVIEKVYWHAGTTLLIGNNYTQSLYIQAGIFNASFTKGDSSIITSPDDMYLLIEPRFKIKNTHMNITVYSLPQQTADQFLFINDTLGANINIYNDSISWGSKRVSLGTNFALSFPGKNFLDLKDPKMLIASMDSFNIDMTPYISTNLLSGEIHLQATVKFMEFFKNSWYNGLTIDLGYRATL